MAYETEASRAGRLSEKILSCELQDSLVDIIKSCEQEDQEVRRVMIRNWQKNEEFWHGVQYLFWDKNNEVWRSPLDLQFEEDFDDDIEEEIGSFSDKVVNVYTGHGSAIIAALAAQLPSLRFVPDDADSVDDVNTARTYDKIGDLVQRHNKAKMIFLKALYFLANQGLVAAYRYKDSDYSYGIDRVPKYSTKKTTTQSFICPICEYVSDDPNAFASGCPQCGELVKPKKTTDTTEQPYLEEYIEQPKTRAKLDIFGPLHFKVPYYARNQKECQYFGLFLDTGKDVAADMFPDLYDEIMVENLDNNDRFGRSIYTYPADNNAEGKNILTVQRWWLRPAAFNREQCKEKREKLKEKYPKGVRVVLLGKLKHFAEVMPETMDDRITIGQSGLSTYIHSDPILQPLVQIQEMRNQLINLIMETIEHGIPATFADPATLNFNNYGKYEAVPGYVYKAKPAKPGDPLAASFYTSDRATLSREVVEFLKQLDEDAQFAVGSFPSIYGGPSEGKSRTFSEYAASRQMALQRLSILWTFLVDWWTDTIRGLVDMYVSIVTDDERFVTKRQDNYINVWIRQSEMQGKVAGVEPEASETFPVTMAQKKDLIMKLMEMQIPEVQQALFLPDNARVIQDVFAMNEFKLPGEAQRVKQAQEISEMIRPTSYPIPNGQPDPMTGQEGMQSSVEVDYDVDDHAVHIATIKAFLIDQVGLALKQENPLAYTNIKLHMKQHQMALMQQTMQAQAMQAGAPGPGGPQEEPAPKPEPAPTE